VISVDFDYSQDEQEFNSYVESVFNDQIKPKLSGWKAENTTPPEMFKILGEAGLLGFREEDSQIKPIPWLENIHYYKHAGQVDGGLAIASFANTQLALQALHYFASAEQKTKYLSPGIKGATINALANTEPGAGSDAAAIALRAEDKGDHYLLKGSKAYITNGDIADHIVVTAVTHPDAEKKHARISMLIVDGQSKGLERKRLDKYPWKISHLSVLNFSDVRVPKENLLGEPQRGFYQTMEVFNTSRIGLAALTFGSNLGAYKLAYKHANSRKVFGRTLMENESKRNEFSDYLLRLEACWLLTQKAAYLKDKGREFRYNSSMAKLFSTEEGLALTHWAVELFGARGVLASHPIGDYHNDVKGSNMGEGAPEVQKKIIAENIEEKLKEF
jgi:alkylation response protein AidB-like acyl-CoA dehydrogenase